ncbi:MAG: thiamine phosphate synthase [Verrucomicrobiota bacterium JB023]|nr:thiamine phosphate synthase [Verrucomicrobiota bacterium JB023]
MSLLQDALFYGIVDMGYVAPEQIEEATKQLLAGGAGIIQLRAKGQAKEQIQEWAQALQPICREAERPFIVNDHIDIAAEVDADGVHLGQDDGPLATARDLLPTGKLVGRSTHSPAQALAALEEGADYIGFGPLFPTPTKAGRPSIGLEDVAAVQASVGTQIPVFCIGGIKRSNLEEVLAAGARRVVIVSDVLSAPNREEAVREVTSRLT